MKFTDALRQDCNDRWADTHCGKCLTCIAADMLDRREAAPAPPSSAPPVVALTDIERATMDLLDHAFKCGARDGYDALQAAPFAAILHRRTHTVGREELRKAILCAFASARPKNQGDAECAADAVIALLGRPRAEPTAEEEDAAVAQAFADVANERRTVRLPASAPGFVVDREKVETAVFQKALAHVGRLAASEATDAAIAEYRRQEAEHAAKGGAA